MSTSKTFASLIICVALVTSLTSQTTQAAYVHPAQIRNTHFQTKFIDFLDPAHKLLFTPDVYTILKESDHEEAHAEPEDIPEQVLVTKMADKLKDKLTTLRILRMASRMRSGLPGCNPLTMKCGKDTTAIFLFRMTKKERLLY